MGATNGTSNQNIRPSRWGLSVHLPDSLLSLSAAGSHSGLSHWPLAAGTVAQDVSCNGSALPVNPLILLMTGPRGVGKTTLCLRTVALAKAAGYSCAGLLTLRENDDQRMVVDVRTGDRRRLTVAGPEGVVVGRYRFDPDALAWGAEILAHSAPCDLLVVDELGPLEREGGGWAVAIDVLREGRFRLGLAVVRPAGVTDILVRLPEARTVPVSPENRDDLPVRLFYLLAPFPGRRFAP